MSAKVINPLTGKPLRADAAKHVQKLRTVRRNAKKAARSGNPAKRCPAEQVLRQVGLAIGAVYRSEATRR
jgi:hypothetical protein